MADIKSLLKEARKLIDDGNFKEAQECCKNILRKDKQNYFALILLGKSLEDSDQAPLAYQKAISSKPDHPLAWQGLSNYYERKTDSIAKYKLFTIYDEILKLNIEHDKGLEVICKLGQLGISLKNNEAISILLRYLANNNTPDLVAEAKKQLIEVLKVDILVKEDEVENVIKILQEICDWEPNQNLELLLGKVILQQQDIAAAINEVIHLKYFSNNALLKEWLCKYLFTLFVQNETYCGFDAEKWINIITDGVENSKYTNLSKSFISYEKGCYLNAYKQCIPFINYQEPDLMEATFIINCTFKLKKWSVMEKLVTNFLTKAKDEEFVTKMQRFLFLSLAKQCKWKNAVRIVEDIPIDSLSEDDKVLLAECYIELSEPVNTLLDHLTSSKHYIELTALLLMKQEKYEDAIAALQNSPESVTSFFYLGKAYWEIKQYDKCLINLLKAAKMDGEHSDTFLYLGNYYNFFKQDLEKAKKCYEKAYSLNCMNTTTVKSLSEVYTKLILREVDFDFLQTALKNKLPIETWIHFRLGLHYINRRDWENAIISFRNVIKGDQTNTVAFECLADAYYSRGSFTSALKAYSKVMTLNPQRTVHCLTRTGYIYSLLTQYKEAVTTFDNVLMHDPNSLLALKGISEAWIRIAKKKEAAKLYGTARDCAQQAINYITTALSKHKLYFCLWKLLADTLMFITKLPHKYAFIYMKKAFDASEKELTKKDKVEIYPQAIACYSFIAKQKQHVASYDLASTYLNYYYESQKTVNCNIAYNLMITCLKEKPDVWRNWNLLGKICLSLKKYYIAQHCFIKALVLTRKWSVAKIWCNLGTMYLKLKLFKLANYCFWRGQSTLPSYPQSWIGQALIAEQIREVEAMDLFRHACRLGYHPESALGYADWVCRTLKICNQEDPESKYIIEGLHAIPYAMDLIDWYLNFEPNNACAYIILGILQERSNFLSASVKSYEKAFKYAKEDQKNIALLNIGRILIRLEKYDEAIKVFKAITEASLNSTSGLALALFKKGLYEESYSAYDTALHWLSNNDDEKADLLVAMAGIIYMFKGSDDAKTLLFHSIQISQKKPTAFSLFAICSLGVIHSDQSMSKLAIGELQKYEKESKYSYDIGFLKSYILVSQNDINEAIKLLSDSLHDHPNNALLWFCMAQYSLRASKAKIASCCAQRALCSSRYSEVKCNPAKMIATASIAENMSGNNAKALNLAKDGLHMYPCQGDIWVALLYSLLSYKKFNDKTDWILNAAGHVRRHLDISRPLSRWVGLLEKKIQSYQ